MWFKIDDTLAFHPKVVAAGLDAMGLWVRAGAWCAQQLTDGAVPAHMVPALADGRAELADRLVEVGLWTREGDTYRFHDWADRNPSREAVERQRAARAEAGRAGGKRSAAVRRSKREATGEANAEASASGVASGLTKQTSTPSRTRPVPSRPEQRHLSVSLPRASARASERAEAATEVATEVTRVVEAWVAASPSRPGRSELADAQRQAAELIEAGNPLAEVVEAARRTGAEGYGPRGFGVALRKMRAQGRAQRSWLDDEMDALEAMKTRGGRGQVVEAEVVELPRAGGDR